MSRFRIMREGNLVRLLVILATPMVACRCAPFTDMRLAQYRDEQTLNEYEYALGEKYIEVDGITMCYQEFGEGETLLMLHGVGTSSDFWQFNIPALAKHYHVLALDLPGFGKSDKPDASYELSWHCDRILSFLDAKGVERAHVMGASMGGHLSLLLALNHPERFPKLIMSGSCGAWKYPGPLMQLGFLVLWNEYTVTDHLRRTWPATFDKIFRNQNEKTDRIYRYQMAVRADRKLFSAEARASMRSLHSIFYSSCRDRLGDLKQPVLLIFGVGDFIHPPEDGEYFHQHFADSQLLVVEDANHAVMADQADLFNDSVIQFLKGEEITVDERRVSIDRGE
ncbi:MAG: alpha/beta fold hydrolase [Planctomycetota bacterium]